MYFTSWLICELRVAQCHARCRFSQVYSHHFYGLLYGLLGAEDYALQMGSLLLFGLLDVFMVLTRKLHWYAVGCTEKADV